MQKEWKWKRKMKKTGICLLGSLQIAALCVPLQAFADEPAQITAGASHEKRQMEFLDRGLVAVKTNDGVFVSWRLLGTEPSGISFNLYRDGKKVNMTPITISTNYLDTSGTSASTYTVRAVVNGKEQPSSDKVNVWGGSYLDVPLHKPADGVNPDGSTFTYNANDASVGDVDGDGQYEIILKWDPSNSKDNSQSGVTGDVFVDAYKLDGTFLWRISLGRNIRAGAHYTQFMVYDLDGDGKAEVAMRTADGAVDGAGKVIGDKNADYRNASGYVLSGPEYLTLFEGATGKELVSVPFEPARGKVTDWGDAYGNRVDRFLATIAYLDGKRPSLVMARGYYAKTSLVAYNWRDGQFTKQWSFTSNGNPLYEAQGNHSLTAIDVDGDGKDEIVYGAMTFDDNGQVLYSTGLGHGDALHVGDLDPDRPGLEVFKVMEHKDSPYGAAEWDAATGKVIWGVFTGKDTGRGMSADIDPRYKGEEQWASGGVGLYTVKGEKLGSTTPSSVNFGIWWDGDLLRELLDHNYDAAITAGPGKIDKWDYINGTTVNLLTASGTLSNNTTKGNPSLQADILGDWREEAIWRTADSSALRIYTTTDVTEHRFPTLMHDPVYRLDVAWQNVAYNQPPHTSYYLGEGMTEPPAPNIYVTYPAKVQISPNTLNTKSNGGDHSITVKVDLPEYAGSTPVGISSVSMNVYNGGTIQAGMTRGDSRNGFTIKFDRVQLLQALSGQSGDVEVKLIGRLEDGSQFIGNDRIQVK
ncbi:rhamnogalacturonan lyase [Paenibacillus rigui]|uniref:rhamnogalacturonan lyase n=1 Tax=Paenibacillus rigui TaxID=554312 RepID=UPI002481F916|nr:rhamnogalacturonan lyase [Paenibacillus rigui]